MRAVRSVVLDNAAVQALLNPAHRKHRRVLAAVELSASSSSRRPATVRLVVPTSVRVEAGWDRRPAAAAVVNRLRVHDAPLDTSHADRAAALRTMLRISVADAHLAAVLSHVEPPVAVLTIDVDDVRRIGAHLGMEIAIVAL